MKFKVRCPDCKQTMRCAPRSKITEVVKQCVYCDRNFKIHPNIKESRIIERITE